MNQTQYWKVISGRPRIQFCPVVWQFVLNWKQLPSLVASISILNWLIVMTSPQMCSTLPTTVWIAVVLSLLIVLFCRLFGRKCGRCHQPLHPNDLVFRCLSATYHSHCFSCLYCGIPFKKVKNYFDFSFICWKLLNAFQSFSCRVTSTVCTRETLFAFRTTTQSVRHICSHVGLQKDRTFLPSQLNMCP